MFKKLSLFTFILFFTFVSATLAHTGLESSNPQNGEVINEELKQITLTFEGTIEQGSTFTLLNANGETITVDNMTIMENILTGDLSTPLENGDYTVDWSIIGEDGHLIEESFTFSVDAPVAETTEENTETEVHTQTNTEDYEENTANQTETVAESDEETSFIFIIIIGVLILIMMVSFVFLLKRKK